MILSTDDLAIGYLLPRRQGFDYSLLKKQKRETQHETNCPPVNCSWTTLNCVPLRLLLATLLQHVNFQEDNEARAVTELSSTLSPTGHVNNTLHVMFLSICFSIWLSSFCYNETAGKLKVANIAKLTGVKKRWLLYAKKTHIYTKEYKFVDKLYTWTSSDTVKVDTTLSKLMIQTGPDSVWPCL